MTNILVPTDFHLSSLMYAEAAIKSGDYGKCNIILFHAFDMPDSPFDLLRRSSSYAACQLMTETFRQACKQLKDEYPKQVGKIVLRTMQGSTRLLFRNFIEANDIDLIYCPENYSFVPVHALSFNPLPLFKKCGIPVIKSAARKIESSYSKPTFNPLQVWPQ